MLWFTADLHLNHHALIKHGHRHFINTEEMNKTIVDRWNSRIHFDDEVWILGDFAYRCKPTEAEPYLAKLNGQKHIVFGNHDDRIAYRFRDKFASYHDIAYIERYGQKIFMCHYPMRSWRNWRHGTWHLHGHCHGIESLGKSLDVGTDTHDYYPYSFDEIREIMSKLPMSSENDWGFKRFIRQLRKKMYFFITRKPLYHNEID